MKYNETRESALGEEFTRGGWGGEGNLPGGNSPGDNLLGEI